MTTTKPKWRKTEAGHRADDGYTITYAGQSLSNRAMYNLFAPDGRRIVSASHCSLADCKTIAEIYRADPERLDVEGKWIV